MELAQTKIPYLPPDWTVARGFKYAAKLGVFILVPGLHQIACKRRILGGLLMVLYFAAEFVFANEPFNFSDRGFSIRSLSGNLFDEGFSFRSMSRNSSEVFQYFSWLLLSLDTRNLENRKLKLNFFLILICAAGVYFVPDHNAGTLNIHIETRNYACPQFCPHDIVQYEPYDRRVDRIQAGDYVMVGIVYEFNYMAKVLVPGPPEEACADDGRTTLQLPIGNHYCRAYAPGKYTYQFLVLGGPQPEFTGSDGVKISILTDLHVSGIRPKKIGNTREYFFLSDNITEFVGRVLLITYEWTGLNLFGLSK